jgi:hypothetical protein
MAEGELSAAVMDRLSAAYSGAFAAMMFVTDPARWAGFAAFAEQHAASAGDPGEWGEHDRQEMRRDALILAEVARALDVAGGLRP